jgi:type IV pilus biogenesis protein PilP
MRNDRAMAVWMVACCFAWPISALAQGGAADAAANATADAAPRATVVPTPAAAQAANELMELQEETLLLKAQLKKLDAQADVFQREQAIHRMGSPVSYGDMSLVATQSLGKTMNATVSNGDGAEMDVHAGDTLPNGMRVVSIRSGAIVLAGDGGRRVTLTVTSPQQAPHNVVATGPAADSTGVPPLPTLPTSLR